MELFPPPLGEREDTKQTLHRRCQVVGELRLAVSVRRNHWRNAPVHLQPPAGMPIPASSR